MPKRFVYVLSDKQKKELLIRGKPLRIALPAPLCPVHDLEEWARAVLPEDLHDFVVQAEARTIYCRAVKPPMRNDLTSHFGVIYPKVDDSDFDDPRPGPDAPETKLPGLALTVSVVIVTLEPEFIRHPPGPGEWFEWPYQVILDGRTLPKEMVPDAE